MESLGIADVKFIGCPLLDAWLIEPELQADSRGMFARTMCLDEFGERGLCTQFVQQSLSISYLRGTIRGLHLQLRPHEETKLVRCTRGAIFDVIVDLRRTSQTYLHHQAFELNDSNRHQLYVPAGFAHGFQTLTDDVEVTYLMSSAYAPSAGSGVRYDDPQLDIDWPLPVSAISDKDKSWRLLEAGPSTPDQHEANGD